jgi:hypothetical protein
LGCELGIGILRDKQQNGFLGMVTFEGQDVIKMMGKTIFFYLFCMK